jgi:hypothetical protein
LRSSKSFRSKNSGNNSSSSKNGIETKPRPYQIDRRNTISSLDVSNINSPTISSSSKLTPSSSAAFNKQLKPSTPISSSRFKSTPSPQDDTDSTKTTPSSKLSSKSNYLNADCKHIDNLEDISITNDYFIDDVDDLSSSDLESSFPDIEIAEIVEQSNNNIKTNDSMNHKFKPILDTKPSEPIKSESRYSPMIKKPASPKPTPNKVNNMNYLIAFSKNN